VRDTGKTPWGVGLGLGLVAAHSVDLGVALDVVNLS
jgi:hypothetical protein